jgi:hypothetical protein
MTKTFRAVVLKCCRAGCSTTTWSDLLDKKPDEQSAQSTSLKIEIHDSTRLCQNSVFCTCSQVELERQLVSKFGVECI